MIPAPADNQTNSDPLFWEWSPFRSANFYQFDGARWQGPYQINELKKLLQSHKLSLEQTIYEGEFKIPHLLKEVLEAQDTSPLNPSKNFLPPTAAIGELTSRVVKEQKKHESLISKPVKLPAPPQQNAANPVQAASAPLAPSEAVAQFEITNGEQTVTYIPSYEQWAVKKNNESENQIFLETDLPKEPDFLHVMMPKVLKIAGVLLLSPLFGLTGLYGTKLVLEWLDPVATDAQNMAEYQEKQQPQIKISTEVKSKTNIVESVSNPEKKPVIAASEVTVSSSALPPQQESTPRKEMSAAKNFYFKSADLSTGFPLFSIKVVKPHLEKVVFLIESVPNETLGVEQYFKSVLIEARSQDWLTFGPFHQQQTKLADGNYQVSVVAVFEGRQIESVFSQKISVGEEGSQRFLQDDVLKLHQAQMIKEALRASKNNLSERVQQVETWLQNAALDEKSIAQGNLSQLITRFNQDWDLKWSELEKTTEWFTGTSTVFTPRFWNAELEWLALLHEIKSLNTTSSTQRAVSIKSFKKFWQKIKAFKSTVEQLDPQGQVVATDAEQFARRVLAWQQNF